MKVKDKLWRTLALNRWSEKEKPAKKIKSRKNHKSCVIEAKREKMFRKEGVVNNAKCCREFEYADSKEVELTLRRPQ